MHEYTKQLKSWIVILCVVIITFIILCVYINQIKKEIKVIDEQKKLVGDSKLNKWQKDNSEDDTSSQASKEQDFSGFLKSQKQDEFERDLPKVEQSEFTETKSDRVENLKQFVKKRKKFKSKIIENQDSDSDKENGSECRN